MKYKKMFIALAVVLAAGIGAVFYARGDQKTKEVQYLSASWDYSYRDVEEIARASDRIALVSVGNVEILVFCKENADGTYRILGGPQGRLVYDDGTLNSISTVLAQEGEEGMLSGLIVENADARALIREIQGYVGAS